jgi:NAD(P)-dependent dehydrogenase (short-subunit alcohol dehydrogenase family)
MLRDRQQRGRPLELAKFETFAMSEGSQPAKYGSKLLGKRVLVLGGTSGIGFCVAEAAREFGATIIVSGSNQSKLENALQRIERSCLDSPKGSIRGYAQDLSDVTKLESNLETILRLATEDGSKKLDHIVYTAGNVVGLVDLADLNTDIITANGILRFHVPIMIGKIAPKYLTHSYESSITFTSGYSHIKPRAGRVLMGGWAAGVEGVTRALAVDLRPIRVNCVCPGAVHTELFDRLPKHKLDPLVDAYVSKTLTGTIGRPEQAVEAYLFCMKDSFIDGTIVHTNGGYLLG